MGVENYGVKIWDADGNVILDPTGIIARLRYSVVAAAGVSGSIVLADISGKDTIEFGILNEDEGGIPHHVYRSGTTIYWNHETLTHFGISRDTLVLVFLYS